MKQVTSTFFAILFSFTASTAFSQNTTISTNSLKDTDPQTKQVSFTSVAKEKSIILNWVTIEQTNAYHYEVERSFNGTDFTKIGLVLDGFEDGAQKNYGFKDTDASLKSHAVVYYRLKQVDQNGNFLQNCGDRKVARM